MGLGKSLSIESLSFSSVIILYTLPLCLTIIPNVNLCLKSYVWLVL